MPDRSKLALFTDVLGVRKRLVNQKNALGGYQFTTFDFDWYGTHEERLFSVTGTYNNEEGPPEEAGHRYHFGAAGERVWNEWLFPRLVDKVKNGGTATFRVVSGGAVTVGNGFIDLEYNGKTVHLPASEIESISLEEKETGEGDEVVVDQVYSVRKKGAVESLIWGTSGIVTFKRDDVLNSTVFAKLLAEFVPSPPLESHL